MPAETTTVAAACDAFFRNSRRSSCSFGLFIIKACSEIQTLLKSKRKSAAIPDILWNRLESRLGDIPNRKGDESAMFAAATTMYAAVSSRGREIGTLRAVGFPRRTVLTSFLLESLVLCLLGGLLGCLATIPLNGISGGTQNAATFSEITFSFRFGPKVLLQGMALAVAMGLIGGLFPAMRAIRLEITDALRQR